MRERSRTTLLIVLVSLAFLVLGLNSGTELIGKASSIFTGSNVMVSPQIIIIYTKFSGSTTDFSLMNFTGLQSIDNMSLEIPMYGKMEFSETVNITACMDAERVVNLNEHVDITTNSVSINTSGLPCLDKPATISLYQINFDSPRILRNGEPCPADVCTIVSYEKGVLMVFSVTGFTTYTVITYSVEETVAPAPPGPGAGPIGPPAHNFTVDRELFKVSLKQGETLLDSLTIKNTGTVRLRVSIDIDNLRKYVMLSEDLFYLEPGQNKTISVAFTAPEYEQPDVYPGRFIIEGDSLRKIILVVMEIREKRPLFDILVSTKETPQNVCLGEEVEADILMYNFGDLRPVDVSLYYSLRDFDGNDLLYTEETFAVQEQKLVTKRIRIPEDFEPDYYLFYARLTYGDEAVSSSGLIRVLRKEIAFYFEPWLVAAVMLAIFIIAILVLFLRKKVIEGAWAPALPRVRLKKKRELRDIEREIGKEMLRIKARKPSRKKEIQIESLLIKSRKKKK